MVKAVNALRTKQMAWIILTWLVVEAVDFLGFFSGSLSEKTDFYLYPLYDMMDSELIPELMSADVIKMALLKHMRGRTLNDAFIVRAIRDSTAAEQMKMFLIRLGFGLKVVVTGNVTQVDLPGDAGLGLRAAVDILENIDDIHVAGLASLDVVRYWLASEGVEAYAKYKEPDLRMNRAAWRAFAVVDDGGVNSRMSVL
ncbi:hypothetical protein MUBE_03160 [Mycobacterium uberis]|uniref:PhoH-like protein n=1 Tax=Mycobacterium uberis TaxID=2162698 RepID=A0A3E1HKJ9_9MYCO|nr:hypothetical protein MUBE_03160 [Mycobacterium uberis]